jgi:outer membrane protein OmpA-like peptidoglycan-associated protein
MTPFSSKTVALAAVITLGSLMSSSAHAGILRTADGTPVLTKDGIAVLTDGMGGCDAEAMTKVSDERVVYFDFAKSGLTAQAHHQLSHLAKKLHHTLGEKTVSVVGFADRVGNAAFNEKLALNRAKAVRDFLVAKGIKADKIQVRSLGKSEPKTNCAVDMPRAAMISCLSEDRRVEIEIK